MPVDVSKAKNGEEARNILLKSRAASNMYEKIRRAQEFLKDGVEDCSEERAALEAALAKCADALKPFYDSFDAGDGMRRITLNDIAEDTKLRDSFLEIYELFTGELGKAASDFRKKLLEEDKSVKEDALKEDKSVKEDALKEDRSVKEDGAGYRMLPPGENIREHVVLDEIREAIEGTKTFLQNLGRVTDDLEKRTIRNFTMEELFIGRGPFQKKLADFETVSIPARPDQMLKGCIDLLEAYKLQGNVFADQAFEKLKALPDLDAFYKADGKDGTFPALDGEGIRILREAAALMREAAKPFLDEAGKENANGKIIPEALNEDGTAPDYAQEYLENLTFAFRSIHRIGSVMQDQLEKAEKHPELHTLPALMRAEAEDYFLGGVGVEAQIEKISAALGREPAEEGRKAGYAAARQAMTKVSEAARKLQQELSSMYELDEEGYCRRIGGSDIETLRARYEELDKEVADNESVIRGNCAQNEKKNVENAFHAMKAALKQNRVLIQKALEDSRKYRDESPEKQNYTLPEILDPNPAVRERMRGLRARRIDFFYGAQEEELGRLLTNPGLDEFQAMNIRLQSISWDREFSEIAKRESHGELLSKTRDVLRILEPFYKKDRNGALTKYIGGEDKQKLLAAMDEAREAISRSLSNKKSPLSERMRLKLSELDVELREQSMALRSVPVSGFFPLPEIMDAARKGGEALQKVREKAQGYDRYDWTETDRKNDLESVNYATYKNPMAKVLEDIRALRKDAEDGATHFGAEEKELLETLQNYIEHNFGQEYMGRFFEKVKRHDPHLDIDADHYPMLTKAEQDVLHGRFTGLKAILDDYAGSPAYRNSINNRFQAFLNGVGTYTNTTVRRLDNFGASLEVPLFTIQEAMSGMADTSDYNFRNELEHFSRFNNQNLINVLKNAKILLDQDDKFEIVDGQKVRKTEADKATVWERILSLGRYRENREFVRDYNDLLANLELLREFELDYFRCNEKGEYPDLPRDRQAIRGGGFTGKINSVEKLQYVYEQIQYISVMLLDKAELYNTGKREGERIPQDFLDALHGIHQKGMICQTLVCQREAEYTKPDCINIMEMIHSDPQKRESLWKLRQNRIFHNARKEEGQVGSYRELRHFQFRFASEETYNGRFYDMADVPSRAQLPGRLDEALARHASAEGVNPEAVDFARALCDLVKSRPEALSALLPTISDIRRRGAESLSLAVQKIREKFPENEALHYGWQYGEADRNMILGLAEDFARLGINRADHKARKAANVGFGEDLTLHPVFVSRVSEILGIDHPLDRPEERVVPRAELRKLTVPGEESKVYTGIMVETGPDELWYQDPVDHKNKKAEFISGRDLLLMDDPENVTIDQFESPGFLKDLANVQALCFLCSAPVPPIEKLSFALVPGADGKRKARLAGFLPDPAFCEGDFPGKLKPEDLCVLTPEVGDAIRNIMGGTKEQQKKRLDAFVERVTAGFPDRSQETMDRIRKVVSDNVGRLGKVLQDPKKCYIGPVESEGGFLNALWGGKTFENGIREGKILITGDFGHLSIDKLAMKPALFSAREDGRKNIFTDFSNFPERAYYRLYKKEGLNRDLVQARAVDGAIRDLKRLNLEASIADFQKKDDAYFLHFDSDKFTEMSKITTQLRRLEETKELDYEDEYGQKHKVSMEGELRKDAINSLRRYYRDAQREVKAYIKKREGIFFGPITDMGKRRLAAARELDTKLESCLLTLDTFNREAPTITEDPLDGQAYEPRNRKKLDIRIGNERQNGNGNERQDEHASVLENRNNTLNRRRMKLI